LDSNPNGYSFEHKEEFKPLQAADILAWQMNNLMRRLPDGEESLDKTHLGFIKLRRDQHMDLGFFTDSQLVEWVRRNREFKEKSGFYL
jgi:hypothetical protein